jgi:hypothetical protein
MYTYRFSAGTRYSWTYRLQSRTPRFLPHHLVLQSIMLRRSCLVVGGPRLLFPNYTAYLTNSWISYTLGPKLGMRQMIISRYSFGYRRLSFPPLPFLTSHKLTKRERLDTMVRFYHASWIQSEWSGSVFSNCILGGQALASVTDQHLSWTSVFRAIH